MKLVKISLYIISLIIILFGTIKILQLNDHLGKIVTSVQPIRQVHDSYNSTNNAYSNSIPSGIPYIVVSPDYQPKYGEELYYEDETTRRGDFLNLIPGNGDEIREEIKKDMVRVSLIYGFGAIFLFILGLSFKKEKFELKTNNQHDNSNKRTKSNEPLPIIEEKFENGIQYQKLAESINGCYLMLQDIKNEIRIGNENPDHLFYVCYLVRGEILDRIDKYKWNLNTPIIVPMMPGENKTLQIVLNILKQNINSCAQNISYYNECHEILRKDDFYFYFESGIPPNAKSNFQ